jgi:hypothetical protein
LRGRQLAKVNNCEQLWGSRPDDLYGLSLLSALLRTNKSWDVIEGSSRKKLVQKP